MQNPSNTIQEQLNELRLQVDDLRMPLQLIDDQLVTLARHEYARTGNTEVADRTTRQLHRLASRLYAGAVQPNQDR